MKGVDLWSTNVELRSTPNIHQSTFVDLCGNTRRKLTRSTHVTQKSTSVDLRGTHWSTFVDVRGRV